MKIELEKDKITDPADPNGNRIHKWWNVLIKIKVRYKCILLFKYNFIKTINYN